MKKLLAMLLAVIMVAAMTALPVTALADDEPAPVGEEPVPAEELPVTVECDSVTVDNDSGKDVSVNLRYTGTELISSFRFKVNCDVPLKDVYSDLNVQFNPEEGLVIIWADDGASFGACTLCSMVFEITGLYEKGTYPIGIELVDVTAASALPTTLKASDGELIINKDPLMGDVDFDGDVDNTDLIRVARFIVKMVEFTPRQVYVGDMDHSGEITNSDLITIARIIVGLA
ncbi:MAG: hypothetical protein IJL71_01960 [Oscillospiraceae bacterium]|nr:hypothetical protein [Oscillospiraceae bacterium]